MKAFSQGIPNKYTGKKDFLTSLLSRRKGRVVQGLIGGPVTVRFLSVLNLFSFFFTFNVFMPKTFN